MTIKYICIYYAFGHYIMQKSISGHSVNNFNIVTTSMQQQNATTTDELRYSLITRLNRFTEIIQRTYIYICDNKKKNIVKGNDLKISVSELRTVRKNGMDILNNINTTEGVDYEYIISNIQNMNTMLSNIIKKWGLSMIHHMYYR